LYINNFVTLTTEPAVHHFTNGTGGSTKIIEIKNLSTMKKFLTALSVTFLLSVILHGYTSSQDILYKEQDGVRITYTKQQHTLPDHQVMEYLVMKIENRNAHPVTISWKLDLWYNGNCRTCNHPSPSGYEFEQTLRPGEVITGDVRTDDLMLRIWFRNSKPGTEIELTKFEFTGLAISRN
jgi:hypothetical protein